MRLLAYEDPGSALGTIGLLVGEGVTPLASIIDFYADVPRYVALAQSAARSADPISMDGLHLIPPVPSSARVLCAGLNYASHAAETRKEPPTVPDLFARWASTLVPTGARVPTPAREGGLDWEGELAAIIGKPLRDADAKTAAEGILGYTCFNDLTARGFQFASSQYALGKNADCSGPIGSVIATPDEVDDANDLLIETKVNGERVQFASTRDLIFSAAELAAYASGCMTLLPGDVISTGTPDGVGFTSKPPRHLHAGDTVTVAIQGIGLLSSDII